MARSPGPRSLPCILYPEGQGRTWVSLALHLDHRLAEGRPFSPVLVPLSPPAGQTGCRADCTESPVHVAGLRWGDRVTVTQGHTWLEPWLTPGAVRAEPEVTSWEHLDPPPPSGRSSVTALQLDARQIKVSRYTRMNLPSPSFSPESGHLAKIASFNHGICER